MRGALLLLVLALSPFLYGAAEPHVITFGKPYSVPWFVGSAENTKLQLNIRPLYVDGKLREFTVGKSRDITDHSFVVRQAYRINDQLPQEPRSAVKWKWQRGGWLLVDRQTGRVSRLNLPDFEPFYSAATWFRDYVAYCGISEDGEKLYAVVAEIGHKKPLVRSPLGNARNADQPDSECDAPTWQRPPVQVTFAPKNGKPVTFQIRGQSAGLASAADSETQ
jgi:hypothetical protein